MRQVTACLLLVLASAALLQVTAAAQTISFEPKSFDFGDMEQQQTRVGVVTVTNVGTELLHLVSVTADCGCTVPAINNDRLDPGESTEIEITFSSKKMVGTQIKAVHIQTNDPKNGTVEVMVKANIHTALIINPASQRVGFSQSLQGDVLTKSVTFTATEAPELEISADKTREGFFEVKTLNGYEGDPKVSLLEIIVPADMEPGRHRDLVRVMTNIESMPTVDIEMQCRVLQPVTASPEQVSFRYKRTFKQTIRVAPFKDGVEFKVTGAEIDLPEILVEVIEAIPNVQTSVIISGTPIGSSDPRAIESNGHIKGTLVIHTDHPQAPVIKIPVTYMVRL